MVLLGATVGACRDRPAGPRAAGPASASATASAPASATATATRPLSGTSTTPSIALGDAGSSCRLEFGPIATDFFGPAVLAPAAKGVLAIGNDNGAPHVCAVETNGAPAVAIVPTSSVPCGWARGLTFCPDAGGAVHERDRAGADVVVARSRPGTRVAAAETGGHALLAFLSDRETSEGTKQIAQLWADDGHVERLSDDGNGATFVDLAARDGEAVAMFIDAHMGMTPVHARTVRWEKGLVLGADTVLFVAGNAESETRGALATRHDKGPSFALVPIAKDTFSFGVAAIEIATVPAVQAHTTWSLYDNGLDPVPIAASRDASRLLVARVRPEGRAVGAPRVLELGTLDDTGQYASFGTVATRGPVRAAALAADATGVWLAYTDLARTWVERRTCP